MGAMAFGDGAAEETGGQRRRRWSRKACAQQGWHRRVAEVAYGDNTWCGELAVIDEGKRRRDGEGSGGKCTSSEVDDREAAELLHLEHERVRRLQMRRARRT